MSITIVILLTFILLFLYQRHIPVLGIGKLDLNYVSYSNKDVAIVDARNYQSSSRETIDHAFCIPLPYLNRHFNDIPNNDIIIIASDNLEKNLSTRVIRKKECVL